MTLLHTMKSFTPAGVEFLIYESLATLPPFNPDLDNEKLPPAVKELRGMLNRSNAILISTPEYAHGIPGTLKNALDWLVSTVLLENKPVAIVMGSSSDGSYARDSLVEVLKTMNASVPSHLVKTISGLRERTNDPQLWQEMKDLTENLILASRPKS